MAALGQGLISKYLRGHFARQCPAGTCLCIYWRQLEKVIPLATTRSGTLRSRHSHPHMALQITYLITTSVTITECIMFAQGFNLRIALFGLMVTLIFVPSASCALGALLRLVCLGLILFSLPKTLAYLVYWNWHRRISIQLPRTFFGIMSILACINPWLLCSFPVLLQAAKQQANSLDKHSFNESATHLVQALLYRFLFTYPTHILEL